MRVEMCWLISSSNLSTSFLHFSHKSTRVNTVPTPSSINNLSLISHVHPFSFNSFIGLIGRASMGATRMHLDAFGTCSSRVNNTWYAWKTLLTRYYRDSEQNESERFSSPPPRVHFLVHVITYIWCKLQCSLFKWLNLKVTRRLPCQVKNSDQQFLAWRRPEMKSMSIGGASTRATWRALARDCRFWQRLTCLSEHS